MHDRTDRLRLTLGRSVPSRPLTICKALLLRFLFLEEGGMDAGDVAHIMIGIVIIGGFIDVFGGGLLVSDGFVV